MCINTTYINNQIWYLSSIPHELNTNTHWRLLICLQDVINISTMVGKAMVSHGMAKNHNVACLPIYKNTDLLLSIYLRYVIFI